MNSQETIKNGDLRVVRVPDPYPQSPASPMVILPTWIVAGNERCDPKHTGIRHGMGSILVFVYHEPVGSNRPSSVRGRKHQVGLWIVGAAGGVGATVALGVAALRKGVARDCGLVSALPVFDGAGLIDPTQLVIGGHEVRSESMPDAVRSLQKRAGLFEEPMIRACLPRLRAVERNIRSGVLRHPSAQVRAFADRSGTGSDRCPAAAVERLSADMRSFRERNRLDRVIVINLSSSEPPVTLTKTHTSFSKLRASLAKSASRVLPASSLYALAAVEAGCAFIDFTPSLGIRVPAIQERAAAVGVPWMGCDGKTGETLVKSALAPLFAMRNLNVLSWTGQNLLGNRDGAVLRDPRALASKRRSKDKTVAQICGPDSETHVGIDYVASLDDWKVAWDFIHFQGFLGTKMTMQFTWQGCDSILAAPLVIDLARFAALACASGETGPMRHLACFFKDPIGVRDKNLFTQWQRLVRHVTGVASDA